MTITPSDTGVPNSVNAEFAARLAKAGGRLSGALTLADAAPSASLNPASKQYADAITGKPAAQAATGQFFAQNGAQINRLNDRVFVGPATAHNGAYPFDTQSWLDSEFMPHDTIVGTAQFASLGTFGLCGGVFASRSSDSTDSGNQPIGLGAYVVNDNATHPQLCFALYVEARTKVSVGAQETIACEMDIVNVSGAPAADNNPYLMAPEKSSINLWLASGGQAPGARDASLALGIQNNGAGYKTGIMFAHNAIAGTDGITAGQTGTAIQFAKGHTISWTCNVSNTVSQTATITCLINDPAKSTAVQFNDNGFQVTTPARVQFGVSYGAPTPGTTPLGLLVSNNAGINFVPVTLGAPNSGGAGFRALVVPN
jgi:hypothetical protein